MGQFWLHYTCFYSSNILCCIVTCINLISPKLANPLIDNAEIKLGFSKDFRLKYKLLLPIIWSSKYSFLKVVQLASWLGWVFLSNKRKFIEYRKICMLCGSLYYKIFKFSLGKKRRNINSKLIGTYIFKDILGN